ncbi:hypothetical protein GQ44DRAFT_320549 [Phaeosphaeriaceae sp. PMI808]|nr:hypothetical protein GQ44DRAFT_320549 [Phaeosphaeriaceae sp. PMI808]
MPWWSAMCYALSVVRGCGHPLDSCPGCLPKKSQSWRMVGSWLWLRGWLLTVVAKAFAGGADLCAESVACPLATCSRIACTTPCRYQCPNPSDSPYTARRRL